MISMHRTRDYFAEFVNQFQKIFEDWPSRPVLSSSFLASGGILRLRVSRAMEAK